MENSYDYLVCSDCLMAIVYDDYTGLDYSLEPKAANRRMREIKQSITDLGPLAPVDYTEEFNTSPCDCCGCHLAGERHGVAEIKIGVRA